MTDDLSALSAKLSEAQRRIFFRHLSTEWSRVTHVIDSRGGRTANWNRRRKLMSLGLLEHRINAGAEYRLTPLGLALRDHLNGETQP